MGPESLNFAGRPLIIGDTVATPTSDGRVNLQNQSGASATVEMEEFKRMLLASAQKAPQTDTTSFSANEPDVAPAPEQKGVSAGKLFAGVALLAVGIWQHKNISKYAKQAFEYLKGKFGTVEKEVEETVANKASKAPVKTEIKNVKPRDHHNTRKIMDEEAKNIVTPQQQAAYNESIAYKAPTKEEKITIAQNNSQVHKASAEAHQLQNSVKPKSAEALEKAQAAVTNPIAASEGVKSGKLPNGKEFRIDVKEGKVVSLVNGEGTVVTDELKIAKFLSKHGINPAEV